MDQTWRHSAASTILPSYPSAAQAETVRKRDWGLDTCSEGFGVDPCLGAPREYAVQSGWHALRNEGRGKAANHALRCASTTCHPRVKVAQFILRGP